MGKTKKQLDELKIEREEEYEKYKKKAENLNKQIIEVLDNCNSIIGVINGERHLMRKELVKLYDILDMFKLNDEKITPFDFVIENQYRPDSIQIMASEKDKVADSKNKTTTFFVPDPIFAAATVISSVITSHMKNKKDLINKTEEFEKEKTAYRNDLQKRRHQLKLYKDILSIADLYRDNITIIKDCVENKIIPELKWIKAFLYADYAKDYLIDGDDPKSLVLKNVNIAEYRDTLFDDHYQFVKNVFDFYKMLESIFKNPILTNLIKNKSVSQKDKDKFNDDIKMIESKIAMIETSSVYRSA